MELQLLAEHQAVAALPLVDMSCFHGLPPTPLMDATIMTHMKLTGTHQRLFLKGLTATHKRLAGQFAWMSGCSGVDGYRLSTQCLTNLYERLWGMKWDFTHPLVVESNTRKQTLLRQEHEIKFLLDDVVKLDQATPWNIMTDKAAPLPRTRGAIWGFSCTSRARNNSKSAKKQGLCAAG